MKVFLDPHEAFALISAGNLVLNNPAVPPEPWVTEDLRTAVSALTVALRDDAIWYGF